MKSWKNLEPDVVKILPRHYTKGRAGRRIDKVVIHHNGGNLTAKSIYDVWLVRPASAHYQVDGRGVISQHVWDRDTAWHAANLTANRTSIGIEHANMGGASTAIGQKTLEEGAHLTAAVCVYYGLGRPRWMVNVFPHRHFTSTACPGYLAGGQNSQYMARAQYWYDEMTGARPSVTSSAKGATVTSSVKAATAAAANLISFAAYNKPGFSGNRKIVQGWLKRIDHEHGGLYKGEPNGLDDATHRAAVKAYQLLIGDRGTAADGKLGPKQFARLAQWGKMEAGK